MMRRAPIQAERLEQEALVQWFALKYPGLILFAIPNGLARSSSAACSVRGGLVAGMPDLMLCVANKEHHGLFIELKRPKSFDRPAGKANTKQLDMILRLNQAGYMAVIAWGWMEASNIIDQYLST